MFTPNDPDEKSGLEEAIDELFREMAGQTGDSEEYSTMVDQLVKLYSLRENESKKRVSPDTMAIVVGNLIGIILIVGHERTNVVTSKALSFILKLR